MTIADPELFTNKDKQIIYIGAFVKLYNWGNYGQVHKIYEMVEFAKINNSTAKYPHNLDVHYIIERFLIFYSIYVVVRG